MCCDSFPLTRPLVRRGACLRFLRAASVVCYDPVVLILACVRCTNLPFTSRIYARMLCLLLLVSSVIADESLRTFDLHECALTNSHSQHGADLFLLPFLLKAADGRRGTFIEIGALDGVTFSNSLMLERCFNWTGLLIEANPTNFRHLQKARRHALIENSAVCEPAGHINFTSTGGAVAGSPGSFSTAFEKRWHRLHQEPVVSVPCSPLRSLMAKHGVASANFLSLDVEGAEETVIKSVRPSAFDVIFVEMDNTDPAKDRRVHEYILSDREMAHARYFRQISNAIYMKRSLAVTPCGGGCWERADDDSASLKIVKFGRNK